MSTFRLASRLLQLLFLALCAAAFAVDAAERVHVPGTRAKLKPPQGFSPADKFPGFQRTDLGASIMVTEMPAAATEIMKGMTQEGLAARGMTLVSSSSKKRAGLPALILHVTQKEHGTEFHKHMLITGNDKATVMVTGIFPRSAEAAVGASIREAVRSAVWDPGAGIDHFEGLAFRIAPTAKLKLAGRVGNMLVLTESGRMGHTQASDAVYLIGTSYGDAWIDDVQAFSEARAKRTAQVNRVEILTRQPLKIGEAQAFEVMGEGLDAKTGVPIRLYQVVLPERGGYVIIQGLAGSDKADDFVPEFRRITASFEKTRAASPTGDRP